jgi:hypothetical protein
MGAALMWEYLIVSYLTSEDKQADFNKLGRQGWELVLMNDPGRTYTFKRRKERR